MEAKTVLRIETARLIPAESAHMRRFFAIPFSLLLFIFPRGIGFLAPFCIVGIAVAITEGMQDIYYVVENKELGFPRYLDGFTGPNTDIPVWKADLLDIDPFTREETAMEHAKIAGRSDVRKVRMDDQGNNMLVKAHSERRPGTATADQILGDFGIQVNSERLNDGSRVWNVLLSEVEVNCLSEEHARALTLDIAVAIRNHTSL